MVRGWTDMSLDRMLERTFGSAKPIIAMIHLAPLPGAPLYDREGGMQKILDLAAADIEALQAGGVDAVMFGNEGDRPYLLRASPQSLAAMSFAVGELKRLIKVPFGVNYLWDAVATVSLAVASGAGFAREIFTGVYESDMGLWQPDAATALRLKTDLPPGSHAYVQHQCRVRLPPRQPHHRGAGAERDLLLARRCGARLRPDDRSGRRDCGPHD